MTDTTYDFGDGPVPAHRHTNPNGTPGGWVADTATVAPTAIIGPDATVRGRARVGDQAWVGGRARVGGRAVVVGEAWVGDQAWIGGEAWVGGQARVVGEAVVVTSSRDVLTVGPVGSEHRVVTIWRHRDGQARITAGCWTGTIYQLAARIAPGGGHGWPADTADRNRADYETVIALARARQAEWSAETAEVAS